MTQDARPPRHKPTDLAGCHELIDELFDLVAAVVADKMRLEESYAELLKSVYGRRRERFDDPQQLKLFETPTEKPAAEAASASSDEPTSSAADPAASPSKPHRHHGRRRFPAHLPRVRVEHRLPEAEVACPRCGEPRGIIGEEISERLNYVPARYEVLQDVRFKYACENELCERAVTTAPKPPQAIEKGAAAPGLLADIVVSKFTDHLPTYRKEEISDRHGWMIPRTTQCGWLRQTAACTTVLVAWMIAHVLRSRKIHTDDTPVKVLRPGEPQTRLGRFWVYCGDEQHPYTVYTFTLSRARDGPAQFLAGYEGYLQADGYGGYDGIALDSAGKLQLVACGAHVRRKFYAQRANAPDVACPALAWFRQLYLLERQWKGLSDEERFHRRQAEALPILGAFHQWLQTVDVLPKSKIGEAVSYARNQWAAFQRYCAAGYLSIDNNLSERMVKPCAMGRKAWLFLGSENGGATAATLYSLTGSAKANRAHPFFYVRDVLERLPEVVYDARLLPHLQAACERAPLMESQRLELLGDERVPQYLDLLRCHPRALAEQFLAGHVEADLTESLDALLPDRWLAAHPEYRLEINRVTGIPVGLESVLTD